MAVTPMRLPIDYLKQFVPNNLTADKLGQVFTSLGHELESIKDNVLELEITPNRGDCLSVLGLARDLSAELNLPLKYAIPEAKFAPTDKKIIVEFEDKTVCPRYTYIIIEGIKIGPSPEWLQKRLAQFDFRPINNVVDITNLVMFEMGQPLHAFDFDKVRGSKMKIRAAREGEKVVTLDSKKHNLPAGALIIEDNERIIDLAGIMGGENSQVDTNTKTIIFQAAIFDPILIRKTSKALNHQTDASYRYERGVDFEATVNSLKRILSLLKDDIKASEIYDIINIPQPPREIQFETSKINHLLGTDFDQNVISQNLSALGFKINSNIVKVPSWRYFDIKLWQDLAEEVARVEGYEKIVSRVPQGEISNRESEEFRLSRQIRDILIKNGFSEVLSYSFVAKERAKTCGASDEELISLVNAKIEDSLVMRPSILATILEIVARNPWAPGLALFEIGHVFSKNEEKINLLILNEGGSKSIDELGIFTTPIDQQILDKYKIRKKLSFVEVSLDTIHNKFASISTAETETLIQKNYQPVSKFPPAVIDLAFIVEQSVKSDEVKSEIEKCQNVIAVELFDEFASDKFGANKKNLAFHIYLQDLQKSLISEEVTQLSQNIIKNIETKFSAKLRS